MSAGFELTRFIVERLFGLRSLLLPPLDALDLTFRAMNGQIDYPPLSARQLVSGTFWASVSQFENVGRAEARSWQDSMDLGPEDTVLDIGCGCGRVARPLLELLGPEGHYLGGDVDARAIRWCRERIAVRHPRAMFFHIDAYNSIYNPSASQPARDYRFPLGDGTVDRVGLSSVFTHMLPEDVASYLGEIARLLKPGGRVYAGVFLISPERLRGDAGRVVGTKFPVRREGHYLTSERYPDLEVAYDADVFVAMAERCGLRLRAPIRWGNWAGTPGYRPLDVVIFESAA